MKRRHETGFGPGEINIKPPLCLPEKWEVFFDMLRVKMIGKIFFSVKPEPCQAGFIACQQNAAER